MLSTLGGSSEKNHCIPAPLEEVFSQLARLDEAPLKMMLGKIRLIVEPFALLYAASIKAALSSVIFEKVNASCACEGRLPQRRRVVTPDCDVMALVGHFGALKLREVGSMLGKVTDISLR